MTGNQKLPLLLIGKFAVHTLLVEYESNAKAWMVSSLFSWVMKPDKRFQHEHRRVAMALDNCPHPNIQESLKTMKLVFLPPNTTSKLQPCVQGMIQNVKHHTKFLLIRMITAIEAKAPRESLRFAWNNLRPETIQNCFEHCGFKLYRSQLIDCIQI